MRRKVLLAAEFKGIGLLSVSAFKKFAASVS